MEELTVEEIIRYAIRIERESFLFYRKVSRILDKSKMRSIIDELCDQEAQHLNKLKRLISDEYIDIDQESLSVTMDIDTSPFDMIIQTNEIPVQATILDILSIALDRERDTEYTYKMLYNLSNIKGKVKDLFKVLYKSEKNHTNEIKKKIDNIKGLCK